VLPPWSLDYHDGSGNAFRARDDGSGAHYEYLPVRPEHSSTGRYSGGSPKRGPLSEATVSALWDRARTLEADTSLRAEHRAKGTGALALRDAAGTRELIIQRSAGLEALDALIAAL